MRLNYFWIRLSKSYILGIIWGFLFSENKNKNIYYFVLFILRGIIIIIWYGWFDYLYKFIVKNGDCMYV